MSTIEATNEAKGTERTPILIVLFCVLGILGVLALIASFIVNYHALARPGAWGLVIIANLLIMLHAIVRKNRSDRGGEFHGFNLISWFVSGLFLVLVAGLGGLGYFLWAASGAAAPSGIVPKLPKIGEWIGLVFACLVAVGWIRWFTMKKKKIKKS